MGMDIKPLLSEGMNSIPYYTTFPFTKCAGEPDKRVHLKRPVLLSLQSAHHDR